jgi:hypothetical protein
MKRMIGSLTLLLGAIGLVGCLAGLIVIWIARPSVFRSSDDALDAADDALKLVEEKATRADEWVKIIRSNVDPVASKILQLVDKRHRSAEEERELKRIEEELIDRLREVDAMAEAAETAFAILSKTSQLARSLRLPGSRIGPGSSPDEDLQDSSEWLARLATRLTDLRETLAKLREDKHLQKEIADIVVRVTRDVEEDLKVVDAKLQRVLQQASQWRLEIAELRATIRVWTNAGAVIGSVILAWMGLGQLVLMRRTWIWTRPVRATPASRP